MLKVAVIATAGAIVGIVVFWTVTISATVPAAELPTYTPDVENGSRIFNIGGCASCHTSPNTDPSMVDRTRLGGGLALKSPFGTFYVPNISPDAEDGIGKWSEADFVTALWKGTSPGGDHLFPAFPYTSYRLMKLEDVRDLFAYMKALPPVSGKVRGHDLPFPFNIRRLVGGWKLLFLQSWLFEPDPSKSAQWNRGAYLVNGPGPARNATAHATFSARSSKKNDSPEVFLRTAMAGCLTSRRRDCSIGPKTTWLGRKRTSQAFWPME